MWKTPRQYTARYLWEYLGSFAQIIYALTQLSAHSFDNHDCTYQSQCRIVSLGENYVLFSVPPQPVFAQAEQEPNILILSALLSSKGRESHTVSYGDR